MTVSLGLALFLLAASPAAMRFRYGRDWLLRPYGLFVLAGVTYHGLAELAIIASSADELVRSRPPAEYVGQGALVAGAALLASTIGYMLLSPRRPRADVDVEQLREAFDWRIGAAFTAPLLVTTVAGEGFNSGQMLDGAGASVTGFAYQFFVTAILLTSFSLLLRWPERFVAIVAGQSLLMAIAGQRLEVLVAAVVLWFLASRVGLGPSRKQIVVTVAIAGLLAMAIGSVRASAGRELFYTDSGAQARAAALISGILNPQANAVNGGSAIAEASLRLDSNSWSGQVAQAFAEGKEPLGPDALVTMVAASVPSILYPSKVQDLTLLDRSPELNAIVSLGLPRIDFLPGHTTFFYPQLGLAGLLVFSLIFGAVLGWLDDFCLRRQTMLRLVGLLLLVQAALLFERGIPFYLVVGRAFIVIVLLLAGWRWLRGLLPPLNRDAQRASSAEKWSVDQPLSEVGVLPLK